MLKIFDFSIFFLLFYYENPKIKLKFAVYID